MINSLFFSFININSAFLDRIIHKLMVQSEKVREVIFLKYGFDRIDGRDVPQMVIDDDFTIHGKHSGTVHVERGTLTIQGELRGTLDVQSEAKVIIVGKQHGTVSVNDDAEVIVFGELHGTTNVSAYGTVIVEAHGKLAGTLHNNGVVIVKGVFGGAQSGNGNLILEENGYIKQPTVKDGINYYEW